MKTMELKSPLAGLTCAEERWCVARDTWGAESVQRRVPSQQNSKPTAPLNLAAASSEHERALSRGGVRR